MGRTRCRGTTSSSAPSTRTSRVPPVLANYIATNAVVAPSLGRTLSGGAANLTVGSIQPGTEYGERLNQLDLRLGKLLRFNATRTLLSMDIYNLFNASSVLDGESELRGVPAADRDSAGALRPLQRAVRFLMRQPSRRSRCRDHVRRVSVGAGWSREVSRERNTRYPGRRARSLLFGGASGRPPCVLLRVPTRTRW